MLSRVHAVPTPCLTACLVPCVCLPPSFAPCVCPQPAVVRGCAGATSVVWDGGGPTELARDASGRRSAPTVCCPPGHPRLAYQLMQNTTGWSSAKSFRGRDVMFCAIPDTQSQVTSPAHITNPAWCVDMGFRGRAHWHHLARDCHGSLPSPIRSSVRPTIAAVLACRKNDDTHTHTHTQKNKHPGPELSLHAAKMTFPPLSKKTQKTGPASCGRLAGVGRGSDKFAGRIEVCARCWRPANGWRRMEREEDRSGGEKEEMMEERGGAEQSRGGAETGRGASCQQTDDRLFNP